MPEGTSQDVIDQTEAAYSELEGSDGTCIFEKEDLTAMLERWESGKRSTSDFALANCTGSLFKTDSSGWEKDEADDDLDDKSGQFEEIVLNKSFCKFYGDPGNLSSHNFKLYALPAFGTSCEEDPEYVLLRRDDHCAPDDMSNLGDVYKMYCPGLGSGGLRKCPEGTHCFDGVCIEGEGVCENKSGGDGIHEICSGYEFRHDSGLVLKPEIILNPYGGADNIVMRTENADIEVLTNQPSHLVSNQNVSVDSGISVYYTMRGYGTKTVAFSLRTEGGIDPADYNLSISAE